MAAVISTTTYGGTGTDGVRFSSFLVSGRLVIMGLLCTVYTLIGITWYVVYRVVFACIGSEYHWSHFRLGSWRRLLCDINFAIVLQNASLQDIFMSKTRIAYRKRRHWNAYTNPLRWYVTPYRSPGCADVLCGAHADVTDFSYMTLMDKSAVKHNMLKETKMDDVHAYCLLTILSSQSTMAEKQAKNTKYLINVNNAVLKCSTHCIGGTFRLSQN